MQSQQMPSLPSHHNCNRIFGILVRKLPPQTNFIPKPETPNNNNIDPLLALAGN
jgi:hypothetical protein